MSLPVILIVTSQQCGHCVNMRKDGLIQSPDAPVSIKGTGNINWAWNEKFFQKLLRGGSDTGPAKFRVYEVHLATMDPNGAVMEMAEFSLTKEGKVQRIGYYNKDGKLGVISSIGYKQTKPPMDIVPNKTLNGMVDSKIPRAYRNLVLVFPSWIFVNGNVWDSAIGKDTPFYGYVGGLVVIKKDNIYSIDRESLRKAKGEDPVMNASNILNGTLSLNYIEPPPTVKKEEKKTEMITAPAGCRSVQEYVLLPM